VPIHHTVDGPSIGDRVGPQYLQGCKYRGPQNELVVLEQRGQDGYPARSQPQQGPVHGRTMDQQEVAIARRHHAGIDHLNGKTKQAKVNGNDRVVAEQVFPLQCHQKGVALNDENAQHVGPTSTVSPQQIGRADGLDTRKEVLDQCGDLLDAAYRRRGIRSLRPARQIGRRGCDQYQYQIQPPVRQSKPVLPLVRIQQDKSGRPQSENGRMEPVFGLNPPPARLDPLAGNRKHKRREGEANVQQHGRDRPGGISPKAHFVVPVSAVVQGQPTGTMEEGENAKAFVDMVGIFMGDEFQDCSFCDCACLQVQRHGQAK
jgi:hypothetical protein